MRPPDARPGAIQANPASRFGGRELPDLELACLRILWRNGDLNVHDVRRLLRPQRELAYTTVMTVLDRLTRKGAASRRKVGRAHLYHAEIPREYARERAVERLLEVYFDGSRDSLITFLDAATPAVPTSKALPPDASETFDESLL
jgi:predicted transcriptional regulator